MKKSSYLLSAVMALLLISCGEGGTSSSGSSQPPIAKEVQVIVLSGQSNMEGSTFYDNGKDWLRNYLATRDDNIDPEDFFNGIEEVQTSFRNYYPYNTTDKYNPNHPHASNEEDPIKGEFKDTQVGMGFSEDHMGPEIGLAHVVRDYASSDAPIFMIKSCFGGSGFSTSGYTWKSNKDGGQNDHLWEETKEFIHNNLSLIEEMGFMPKVKAWCWHQGESDANQDYQVNNYYECMTNLIEEFRDEFSEYALDQDGENIAFVDCTIYDGNRIGYGRVDQLNAVKKQIAADGENNYIINGSTKEDDGLNLQIGGHGDLDGCDNIYHYITADCFRLGEAYGNILVDNGIIE